MLLGDGLTLSESVIPQTARTMLTNGDWFVPKRGDGPWLEGAPLAQWLTAVSWSLFGSDGRIWPARLPSVMLASVTVLLTAHLAARWFGRTSGLLSGLILATTSQFARQAWRADESTLLTLLVTAALAVFARLEITHNNGASHARRSVWPTSLSSRPFCVPLLFGLLGISNWTGPIGLGPACVAAPIMGFLIWNWDAVRMGRYVWLWGWLMAASIGLAWPLWIAAEFPKAWEFWTFDWGVRLAGDDVGLGESVAKPIWFYAAILPWVVAPWALVVPAGFWRTRHEALAERFSPQRFVWSWALVWPIVVSLVSGKNPQYLLPSLPAWSMLAAAGLLWLRDRIAEWPEWARRPWPLMVVLVFPLTAWLWFARTALSGWRSTPLWLWLCPWVAAWCVWNLRKCDFRRTARALFGSLAVLYVAGFGEFGACGEQQLRRDADFLKAVRATTPVEMPLILDLSVGGTKGFWCQFLLGARAVPIHNVTFLWNAATISDEEFYIVTHGTSRVVLDRMGTVTSMMVSGPDDAASLVLYRLQRNSPAPRVAAQKRELSPLEAKFSTLGPFLEPPLQLGDRETESLR